MRVWIHSFSTIILFVAVVWFGYTVCMHILNGKDE